MNISHQNRNCIHSKLISFRVVRSHFIKINLCHSPASESPSTNCCFLSSAGQAEQEMFFRVGEKAFALVLELPACTIQKVPSKKAPRNDFLSISVHTDNVGYMPQTSNLSVIDMTSSQAWYESMYKKQQVSLCMSHLHGTS